MAIGVSFAGNCGGEPETRLFNNGSSTTFSVAVSQGYFDQSHQWVDQGTAWVRVRPVGKMAQAQMSSISKGVKVLIVGTLKVCEYTDKDGAKRMSLDVAARHIGIAQSSQSNTTQSTPTAQPTQDPWGAPNNAQGKEFGGYDEPEF